MSLIQNSNDVLNIVKAISILGISIFLICFIYYLAMIMRELFKMIRDMRDRINKVDEVIEALKNRIEHSASYLSLIGDGVKKIMEIAKERGGKTRKRKNKTTTKQEGNKTRKQ